MSCLSAQPPAGRHGSVMTDVDRQREWEAAIIAEREGRFAAESACDALRTALAAAHAEIDRLQRLCTSGDHAQSSR